MSKIIQKLQETAKKLLQDNTVQRVIGYGPGSDQFHTTPVFIDSPEEVHRLTFNPFCANNLVKYLTEYRQKPGKTAVVIKGCDARAVNRLLQDNQLEREQVVLLGIPCAGLLDPEKTAQKIGYENKITEIDVQSEQYTDILLAKCRSCLDHNPVIYDLLLGPKLESTSDQNNYAEVLELEKLSAQEKSTFWDRHFSRCLRCYACRNVCPACTCKECIFNRAKPAWVERINNLSQNTAFHLIRAFHVAGRCVDCGECDRVCPVNIPLRHLNRKILKDIQELYQAPVPGTDPLAVPALGGFSADDPEEFM